MPCPPLSCEPKKSCLFFSLFIFLLVRMFDFQAPYMCNEKTGSPNACLDFYNFQSSSAVDFTLACHPTPIIFQDIFFFLRTSDNITSYFKNLFSLHCPQDKVQSFYDSIKEPSKLNCRYYTLLSHHKIIFYAHYNPSSLRELCILISLAFSLAALYA